MTPVTICFVKLHSRLWLRFVSRVVTIFV